MTIIPDQTELENLLKDIPQFSATITSTLQSLSPPLISFLSFKYDNSEIIGEYTLPNTYAPLFTEESGEEKFCNLKDKKIIVYTPSIESGTVYAIKPVLLFGFSSPEEKLIYDSKIEEFKEKFKDLLK